MSAMIFMRDGARSVRGRCKDCNAEKPFRQSAPAGYGAGMLRWLVCLGFIVCTMAAAPSTRPAMESIDASALPAEQLYPQQDFVRRWRPWETKDHKGTLLIQNLKIANVTNQRAMDIALTSLDRPTPAPGEPLTFAKVIIRNCETADVQ